MFVYEVSNHNHHGIKSNWLFKDASTAKKHMKIYLQDRICDMVNVTVETLGSSLLIYSKGKLIEWFEIQAKCVIE